MKRPVVAWHMLLSEVRLRVSAYVVALLPLALVSTALTVGSVNSGAISVASSGDGEAAAPSADPVRAPTSLATLQSPGSTSVVPRSPAQVLASSSVSGIPAAALSAYQRAEAVINAADRTCGLTWQLIAAIGRVESNHGRFGGNVLSVEGVATPGIYGVALDGRDGVALISDADGGIFDHDTSFDRAVGPFQFIPSTWSVVGVDADGDGMRNPQDLDDAALAAAVYLCSGGEDLSSDSGLKSAVFRYNHSSAYVDLVLDVMRQYLAGDVTSVTDGAAPAGQVVPDAPSGSAGARKAAVEMTSSGKGNSVASTRKPVGRQSTPSSDDDSSGSAGRPPAPPVAGVTSLDGVLRDVGSVLTDAQALAQCLLSGVVDNPATEPDELTSCVERVAGHEPKPGFLDSAR